MSLGGSRQGGLWIVAMMIVCMAAMLSAAEKRVYAKTALEFLQQAPKPRFWEGHTLLPRTRWGWTMPFEARVELAENWTRTNG